MVKAWFGLPTEDINRAINCITEPIRCLIKEWILKIWPYILMPLVLVGRTRGWDLLGQIFWSTTVTIVLRIIQTAVERWAPGKGAVATSWSRSQAGAILLLCHNKYWSRIWIVQEVMVAKDIVICCGQCSFRWAQLAELFLQLAKI
jgi:hypothetical protein